MTIAAVKQHLKNHKTTCITGGVCLVVGAAVTLIVLRNQAGAPEVVNKITQVGIGNKATIEVYIEALGDPGNIIQDTATGTIYASQGQAARALGLSASRLSQHLSGKVDNVDGYVFQKLGKATVAV
jgi:hypothetical protein